MARYERSSNYAAAPLWPQVSRQDLLDDVLALPDCVGLWLPDPAHVETSPLSVKNLGLAGGAATPVNGLEGIALSADNAPRGGSLRRVLTFDGSGALSLGDIMPTGLPNRWTKLVVFFPPLYNAPGGGTGTNLALFRAPQGNSNIHTLQYTTSNVTGRVGSAGNFLDVSARVALGFWNYAIHEWNEVTKQSKLSVNSGVVAASATGDTQTSASAAAYLGGTQTVGSFFGSIGLVVLLTGVSDDNGLSLSASAEKLAKLTRLADAAIGAW